MELNIDNCKAYATEANLIKALTKFGFINDRHIVVCNRAGKYTAIFPFSNLEKMGGYVGVYACKGFLTIN